MNLSKFLIQYLILKEKFLLKIYHLLIWLLNQIFPLINFLWNLIILFKIFQNLLQFLYLNTKLFFYHNLFHFHFI